ncbi:MAG TPA: glycoside hydrolase family 97 catalytic domain-containing protein [Bacteroidales bacterium]|nr:glycoside hydrolase family 97 catalytic domain-containing protein [Bacteroidales bacterium]
MNGLIRIVNKIVIGCIGISIILSCSEQPEEWSVASPSGNIQFMISFGVDNQLFYSVSLADSNESRVVLNASPLGILRSDGNFITGLSFEEASPIESIHESFELPAGKQTRIENRANELTLAFNNQDDKKILVIARAYDDGIAFRYVFPDQDSGKYTVKEEVTGFAIAGDGKTWIEPYDKVTMWTPAYERYFENGIPVGTSAPSSEGWAFPALFNTENACILLTEAGADSTYFAAHLQQEANNGLYIIRMPEATEADSLISSKPSSSLPWSTPWRVAIIGKELSTIAESNMVVKLNPPAAFDDVSWIRPGRASWSWWSTPSSPKNYSVLKDYVDLAAEMGWEYSLVDANWDLMEGGNIEQLVKYANTKNVGILMWYNSGGTHNVVTERPRDIMFDPVLRSAEFKKLAAMGVKGVKVDFFQSDKQHIIGLYFDILQDAAENHILVNFHGCTLHRGWNRTWPNLVSMEAVRGAENYGFDSLYPEKAIWHNTILPFTRNVVGSMDYTPVTFGNQKFPHQTTNGHELALSIVFESGILHLADFAESYRNLPAAVRSFLKKIPVAWDETCLLEGEPGKYCIIARRNGNTWYIGGINGTSTAQSWQVDLSRLTNKDFSALIISDGADNRHFSKDTRTLTAGEVMKINVLPAGGFVAILE